MKYVVLIGSTLLFIAVIVNPFKISSGWSAALTFFVGVFYFSYLKHHFSKLSNGELKRFKKNKENKKS